MRKSVTGLNIRVRKDDYPNLPKELIPFNYYYNDGETGHVIMAIPEVLLEGITDENEDLVYYECPVPVKYVMTHGYRMYKNHVIVNIPYSMQIGLEYDDKYNEVD